MYQFKLKHVRSADASISRERNIGLSLVSKDSVYLAVLDDDTYPEPDYLTEIVSFLHSNEKAVGASGVKSDAFTLRVGNQLEILAKADTKKTNTHGLLETAANTFKVMDAVGECS